MDLGGKDQTLGAFFQQRICLNDSFKTSAAVLLESRGDAERLSAKDKLWTCLHAAGVDLVTLTFLHYRDMNVDDITEMG